MADKINLSKIRSKAGYTIKDIASLVGKTERTVYRWENGETEPDKLAKETILRVCDETIRYDSRESLFTFIDLFAGIGGIRKAFDEIGGKCVFTSEWDKYSQLTYKTNFIDEHEIAGDIKKIHESVIPRHNVLLAGFPCQPFSIAGVSKKKSLGRKHGFLDETQGTLFFDVARIIKYHQPDVILLENVKNLLSHDKGNTFQVIKNVLTIDLGYHIEYGIIDARNFVPQHRERVYIIGFKSDVGFKFSNLIKNIPSQKPLLRDILHEFIRIPDLQYTDIKGMPLAKYTLSNKLWQYLQNYAERHREKGNGFGFGLVDGKDVARTLSARYYKDGSEILVKQNSNNPRRLTPRECSRLMGFDDSKPFKIPVSDTQAYRQFGNSVVVPVVKFIASELKPFIVKVKEKTA
ncbi:MAG: DNA (cytosine-5-)-methyltransferase [Spirochaetes bacterium]|nr:DNA (cytosine-5-)-methyltransferase [Spirochaetota bacterium]